jgi:hypothetical protein
MYHDDDELDRALLALPLEPLPDGLRASIMSAIAVVPRPILTVWETVGVGVILALATWLSLLFVTSGNGAGSWFAAALDLLGRFLVSPATLIWVAVGLGAALCLSLATIPRRAPAKS